MGKVYNEHAMLFFIMQLLELVDLGKSITSEEADDWACSNQLLEKIEGRFGDDLHILKMVNTYDYNHLNTVIAEHCSEKETKMFNNGLLGLVNTCQFILNNKTIIWEDNTIEEID